MTMKTLERAILANAKVVLKNPKLVMIDIMEWSTSEKQVRQNLADDEVAIRIPDPGVWIAVGKTYDKRKKA